MHSSVSGVDVFPFVPPLVAFFIAMLTTPAGVSGAFLLLPFQLSVLGFSGPAVTSTNLLYNVVSTPGGIYRYRQDGRLDWRLTRTIIAGTVPGVCVGALLRVSVFSEPKNFKPFVGAVLLGLGAKLAFDLARRGREAPPERPDFSTVPIVCVAFFVGIFGGIYGVSGGSILAPFLVAIVGLAARRVAGAALVATFVTSVAGVITFVALSTSPDWLLGALFGIGGIAGSYVGARMQKRLPEFAITVLLGVLVTVLGLTYLLPAF